MSEILSMDAHKELVPKGKDDLRQAGTIGEFDSTLKRQVKDVCESDLYEFCYMVLRRSYLTVNLHAEVCAWLTKTPPYRKLLLLPRRHAKTSIVAHGLPLHILIQPKEHNLYIPGKPGCDTRIMLAGEVSKRAQGNLSVVRDVLERNQLFRRMWPHCVWENSRRQSPKWSNEALTIPRNENYPDASVVAIGVDGAITGARHDVHIKDDLIAEKAANSELEMQTAINWHKNTRALMDDPDKGLEYLIGTRWAVQDLYSTIIKEDPTVDVLRRSIVEDGAPIYPEVFSPETVEKLRRDHGSMFALLYMNNVGDPELVDFFDDDLRKFTLCDQVVIFEGDGRDNALAKKTQEIVRPSAVVPEDGFERSGNWLDRFSGSHARESYFRFKCS